MKLELNPHSCVYKDHLLSFAPRRTETGRFLARVVIMAMGGERTRSQRFIDLKEFDTEDEAVAYGRHEGMVRVDNAVATPHAFR
jgi:hypothetical protein